MLGAVMVVQTCNDEKLIELLSRQLRTLILFTKQPLSDLRKAGTLESLQQKND
jgi:hypothetical protein